MSYNHKTIRNLGKKIKEKRARILMPDGNKMSQEDLAYKARMRSSHLSLIERSEKRDLRVSTILKICNALGCSFDELVDDV